MHAIPSLHAHLPQAVRRERADALPGGTALPAAHTRGCRWLLVGAHITGCPPQEGRTGHRAGSCGGALEPLGTTASTWWHNRMGIIRVQQRAEASSGGAARWKRTSPRARGCRPAVRRRRRALASSRMAIDLCGRDKRTVCELNCRLSEISAACISLATSKLVQPRALLAAVPAGRSRTRSKRLRAAASPAVCSPCGRRLRCRRDGEAGAVFCQGGAVRSEA